MVRALREEPSWERGLGPRLRLESADAVSGQDDIDALLSQMAAGQVSVWIP